MNEVNVSEKGSADPTNPRSIPEPDDSLLVDDDYTFDAVRNWVRRYVDFRDERHYTVVASWIMATWLVDAFRSVPYLYSVGPPASGKSTVLEMLHEVSYNAFKAGAGITAAALAYVMDRYHPTLLVDETDNLDDEQRSEILAIANSGYKRGGPRVKMIPSGRGFELGSFETFGFKAFASVSYPAPALASRSIMLSMGQQQREVETTLTDESIEIGETIRAGLHAYMLRKKQVDMSEELRKKIAEAIQDGRVREMSLPLLMAAPEKAHEELWAYLEDLDKEHKSSEQTGWESDYIQALVRAEQKVENGKLSLREIQLALAEVQEADPMKTVTARTVSRNLKTLGFSVTRMSGGPIGIVYDNRLVENLKRRFLSGMFTSFTTFTSDADIPFTERASS